MNPQEPESFGHLLCHLPPASQYEVNHFTGVAVENDFQDLLVRLAAIRTDRMVVTRIASQETCRESFLKNLQFGMKEGFWMQPSDTVNQCEQVIVFPAKGVQDKDESIRHP